MTDPIRPTDDDARALARDLILTARFAGLAYRDPEDDAPMVSRVALVPDRMGAPISLVSDLSHHAGALKRDPRCSLLVGEPKAKGDPLTHPRLSLKTEATFVRHGDPRHADLAADFLAKQPKAKLYIGFADFSILTFTVLSAHLNGGFGRAFRLTADDLL